MTLHRLTLQAAVPLLLYSIAAGADRLDFEAESADVGRTTSGPSTRTVSDARARGAAWVEFDGGVAGTWLQLTLPNLLPGRYWIEIAHRTNERMGKWRVEFGEADGSRRAIIHPGFDCNEFPEEATKPEVRRQEHHRAGFRTANVGTVSIEHPGFYTVRFTLLDRAGSGTRLGLDAVSLVADFGTAPEPPVGLRVAESGPVHAVLAWNKPSPAPHGFLIERQSPPASEWEVVGFAPGEATSFVAAGLRPQAAYRLRLRSFSPDCLGAAGPGVTLETPAAPGNPEGTVIDTAGSRIGEGSVVALAEGRFLMLLNFQETVDDFASFSIRRKLSTDGARTWSQAEPFLHDPAGETGYLMPSLLQLRDGSVGLSYSVRRQSDLQAHRVFRRSFDSGRTWSEPVTITNDLPLEHAGKVFTGATGPHDRLIQTENGDLLLPFHLTTGHGDTDTDPYHDRVPPLLVAATVVYRSSDSGATWRRIFGPVFLKGTSQRTPYRYHWFDQVLSEPTLVEHAPGHLLLMMRNPSGFIQQARSTDYGETWTPVHASNVRAPLAPPKLLSVGPGRIALVFNPWVDFHAGNLGARFALGSLVSDDGGRTWHGFEALDFADPAAGDWQFSYPFFFRTPDAWHAFYFGPRGFDLMHRPLPADWFDRLRGTK